MGNGNDLFRHTHTHTQTHLFAFVINRRLQNAGLLDNVSREQIECLSVVFFLCVFVSAHIFCFPSSCWLVGVGDDKNFGAINPCKGALLRARAPGRSVHYAFSLRLRDEPGAVNCYTTTKEGGV